VAPETVPDRERRLAEELTQIRVALGRVAAFEGLDTSPTAMMVDELVRDHEELEARIDAAMMIVRELADGARIALGKPQPYDDETWVGEIREIGRLLQGGTRVPDTPETLKEDE